MSSVVDREEALGPARKRISWGAIIAGAILALVVQIMLGLFGLGVGLASLDPTAAGNTGAGSILSVGGIWALVSVLAGTFVGGYAAARFAGTYVRRDSILHGVTTWAVATLVAVYFLTSGASALVSGAFGALGGTVQAIGQAAGAAVPGSLDALPDNLQAEAEGLLEQGADQAQDTAQDAQAAAQDAAQDARAATGEQDLSAAVGTIVSGLQQDAAPEERQAAVTVISQQAGISEAEAEQRLTEFQARYNEFEAQARQAADQAADAASASSFAAFFTLLLGAAAGAGGGLLGRPRRFNDLYYRD